MSDKRTSPRSRATRIAQLERDITRAVNRLLAEFEAETGSTPHAVDIELVAEVRGAGERPTYVACETRAHFEER